MSVAAPAIAPHPPFGDRHVLIISQIDANRQFRTVRRWAARHGLEEGQFTIVRSPADVQTAKNAHVVWLGSVWERSDFHQLCLAVDTGVSAGRLVVDRREIPPSVLRPKRGQTGTETSSEHDSEAGADS